MRKPSPEEKKNSENIRKQAKDRQFVTALARGLNILKCFDAEHTELGSIEIARMTGLPQPTVWRLCYTLIQCGFLVQNKSNDKLQIGAPILSLGYSALVTLGFDDTVRRAMHQLAIDFDAAVSMAVRDDDHMVITQRARGNGVLLVNLNVGSRLPIVRSSFGWGYLAILPEEERSEVLEQLLPKGHPEKAFLEQNIRSAIDQYEETGYIINSGIYHKHINAVAIPFWDPKGTQIHVLNCGAPAEVLPIKLLKSKVAPRLQEVVELAQLSLKADKVSA